MVQRYRIKPSQEHHKLAALYHIKSCYFPASHRIYQTRSPDVCKHGWAYVRVSLQCPSQLQKQLMLFQSCSSLKMSVIVGKVSSVMCDRLPICAKQQFGKSPKYKPSYNQRARMCKQRVLSSPSGILKRLTRALILIPIHGGIAKSTSIQATHWQ